MSHSRIKLTLAVTGILAAACYLAIAGLKEGWVYYLDVDDFVAESAQHDQRVRLCGRVAETGVEADRAGLTARFDLLGKTQRVTVDYRGVIPDRFEPGVDVVIEGRLSGGVFEADVMITKCASKYQAEEHAKRLEEGS